MIHTMNQSMVLDVDEQQAEREYVVMLHVLSVLADEVYMLYGYRRSHCCSLSIVSTNNHR
jgi:hypothetical protein